MTVQGREGRRPATAFQVGCASQEKHRHNVPVYQGCDGRAMHTPELIRVFLGTYFVQRMASRTADLALCDRLH